MNTKKTNKLSNIFSLKLTKEELENQVNNYDTLKITESYKGISILILIGLLALSFVIALFDLYLLEYFLYGLILYIPVLFFVYKGRRWAIISLMILWTFEQGFKLIVFGKFFWPIIQWIVVILFLYKALVVENARRKGVKRIKNK